MFQLKNFDEVEVGHLPRWPDPLLQTHSGSKRGIPQGQGGPGSGSGSQLTRGDAGADDAEDAEDAEDDETDSLRRAVIIVR